MKMAFKLLLTVGFLALIPTLSLSQEIDEEQANIIAQDANAPADGLFSPADESDLADDQASLLEAIKADPPAAAVRVVTLDIDALLKGDAPPLNTGAEAAATEKAEVSQLAEGSYLWTGTSGDDTSLMVVRGDMVTGHVIQGDSTFEVRPLGNGLHALITIDSTKFPPDCPEDEYKKIADQAEELEVQLDALEETAAPLEGQIRKLDILVAWTQGVKAKVADPKGLALLAIEEANLSYRESGVNLSAHLVDSFQTTYTEVGWGTDLARFRTPGDGHMDEVHNRRKQFGADVCILFVSNSGYCGLASVIYADHESEAFASVHYSCATGNYTFAHEIGHLQGARHNPEVDPSTSPFSYGHGYYNESKKIRTVMSYNCPGGCTRVPRWSGPDVKYGTTTMGDATTRHNARVLNLTATVVTNHAAPPGGGEGYAWAYYPTSAKYTLTGSYWYNSSGESVQAERLSKGRYRVTFYGLGGKGRAGGHVQVSSYGSTDVNTVVGGWSSGGDNFIVYVYCHDKNGDRVDSRFDIHVFWPQN